MHIQINHFVRIYTTIVSNCLNRRDALRCRISRVRLFLGMLVALMLGLGTHVVTMVWLNIPYPYNPPTHGFLLFVNQVLIVGGSLALYHYAAFDRIFPKILIRTFYFFLLLTTLTEQLIRDAVMNGFVNQRILVCQSRGFAQAPPLACYCRRIGNLWNVDDDDRAPYRWVRSDRCRNLPSCQTRFRWIICETTGILRLSGSSAGLWLPLWLAGHGHGIRDLH